MEGYKTYLLPAVAALVLLAYLLFRPDPDASGPQTDAPATKGSSADPTPTPPRPEAVVPKPEDPASADGARAGDVTRRRAARDAMREKIEQALQKRASARRSKAKPGDEDDADTREYGTLSKDYIQARLREDLIPIVKECYNSALEDDAKLAGRLVLKFKITGDESVGGVVESAEIGEDSEITQPDLVECVRESTLAVTFDPPTGGGVVEVHYPFVFQPKPDPPGKAE